MSLFGVKSFFLIIGCCLATAGDCAAASMRQRLQFVTVTRAAGCPLTLHFPVSDNGSSGAEAYLTPALCFRHKMESIVKTLCPVTDRVTNASYLSIPLTVTDSRLLAEAQETLRPLLRDRKLTFLQPLSIREADGLELPLPRQRQLHQETVLVRVGCARDDCFDILSEFVIGNASALEAAQVKVTLHVPNSSPVTMRIAVSVANATRNLSPQKSPSVLPALVCANLRHHEILTVDDFCTVTVLQRTDRKAQYVTEAMLCYYGNHSSEFSEEGGAVTLRLTVKSSRVTDTVKAALSHLSSVSVSFMSLVSADVTVSTSVAQWSFENLRLSADGDTAELRVRCHSAASCRLLGSHVNGSSSDFWRHVSFTVESQLHSDSVCSWWSSKFALPSGARSSCAVSRSHRLLSAFHPITGLLCIRSEFVRRLPLLSDEFCAFMCSRSRRCQAFSTDGGTCQLFLFDRCSKNVRDCACDRRGLVFVKRQQGLEPGRLCPTGYGSDLCGVKYKVHNNSGNWHASRAKCESESGLVIMADVMDAAEMTRVELIYSTRSNGNSFWLGGLQSPGSAEPAGGWFWVACNITVDGSLWGSGEPNNAGGGMENVIGRWSSLAKLTDLLETSSDATATCVLCECVSPFD